MSGPEWWHELVDGQWWDTSSCQLSAQPAHSPAVRCPGPAFGSPFPPAWTADLLVLLLVAVLVAFWFVCRSGALA